VPDVRCGEGFAWLQTNPAPAGSVIQIFATGAGRWNKDLDQQVIDPAKPPYPVPLAPVSLTIGGQAAQVAYAGAAPGQVFGVLQVNAVVPAGLAAGPQPVVLTVGKNDNSSQAVTVSVR